MMGYGWGMGPVGWIFMAVVPLGVFALAVWAIVSLSAGTRFRWPGRPDTPAEILARRFATGEIDLTEYRQARAELGGETLARPGPGRAGTRQDPV
ncbi:SHOCT domain-containing protein [Micromonospora zhanjiangensis]|uniref:SHOCT domain-containing protein n=1 Tax=Micromonospora zhanjiangensis TaxID=1522057 RepID=A0ABV8KNM5_9ACTN